MEQLCKGICSVPMMKRIEDGDRLPSKLMRDTFIERLGHTNDNFEEYLDCEEYDRWENRMGVLKLLDDGAAAEAIEKANIFKSVSEETIEKQYYSLIIIAALKDRANFQELKSMCKEAIEYTMPFFLDNPADYKCFSLKEIIAILDYYYYLELIEKNGEGYEKIIWLYKEIEKREYSRQLVAKIYVAISLVLGKLKGDKDDTMLEIYDQTIEALRNTSMMYGLTEIEKNRKQIIDSRRMEDIELTEIVDCVINDTDYLKTIFDNEKRHSIIYCFLYERDVYEIGETIRVRRKMLGMTQEQLAEGLCSVKTLNRIENGKAKTQMPIIEDIFDRLGMARDYRSAEIITDSDDAYELLLKIAQASRRMENRKVMELLDDLEKMVDIGIYRNKVFIERLRIVINYMEGQYTEKTAEEKLRLLLTKEGKFDFEKLDGRIILTRTELACLLNYCRISKTNQQIYNILLKEIEKYSESEVDLTKLELTSSRVASSKGDIGEYEISNKLSFDLIKVLLENYMLKFIHINMHSMKYNMTQCGEAKQLFEKYDERRWLEVCKDLAVYCKETYCLQVYTKELNALITQ